MFTYNLKVVLRNLLKNKGFTIINIAGFSIGLACSLVILVYVYFELSFDQFHENFRNIYEVQQKIYFTGGEYTSDRVGGAYARVLSEEFPEIEKATRIGAVPELLVSYIPDTTLENKDDRINYIEKAGLGVDSTFLQIFSFNVLSGNQESALKDKYSILLTESMADKYFPGTNPIGQTMILNEKVNVTVTAVLKDPPVNSNIQFTFLLPIYLFDEISYLHDDLGGTAYYTYLLLNDKADYHILNEKIPPFIHERQDFQLESKPFLQPLRKVHLHDEKRSYIGVYTFGAIAILILLTACINFINLTTSKSIDRAREVGIRKTEGASRYELIKYFLGETFLITFIGLVLALILIELILPVIGQQFDVKITVPYSDISFLSLIMAIFLVTAVVSGIYPAFYLSSFRPLQVIHYKGTPKSGGSKMRKILVVTQFFIASLTIICTIVLISQLKFMKKADIGINKEDILIIPTRGKSKASYELIKNDLLKSPEIQAVTISSELPDNINYGEIEWGSSLSTKDKNQIVSMIIYAGTDFDQVFDLPMKEGRFYSDIHASDSTNGVIINEDIVRILDYKNPIGAPFYLFDKKYTVIGVVGDFHFSPFNIMANKAMFIMFGKEGNYIFVRYKPGTVKAAIQLSETVFQKYNPNYPFEYYYYKDYDSPVIRIAKSSNNLMTYFVFFGIIISCMGLFGLSINTAEKSTKEIGIRKTFGASEKRIIFNLIGKFSKLVFLANLLAIPLAYIIMVKVLSFFAYRIHLSIWYFLATMTGILAIAIVTVSSQSIMAARRNPVESLRYE